MRIVVSSIEFRIHELCLILVANYLLNYIGVFVQHEHSVMGNLVCYNSAFNFLRKIQERYNSVVSLEVPARYIHFVPQNSLSTSFVRFDATTIKNLHKSFPRDELEIDYSDLPGTIEEMLSSRAKRARQKGEMLSSFTTDGVQIVLSYDIVYSKRQYATDKLSKAFDEIDRKVKIYEWRKQRDMELPRMKPCYMVEKFSDHPKRNSFKDATSGLFSKHSAHLTEGEIPVVISCDPGHKNIHLFTKLDQNWDIGNTPQDARKISSLSRARYNNETWLKKFQIKLERKLLRQENQVARNVLCQNSLKGVMNCADFNARYIRVRDASHLLRKVYRSYEYRKWCFRLYQKNQKFDADYVNKTVKAFERETGGENYIVAYGDGSFPLTMKGVGSSAHKRLMRLLSKRVRVVMTNAY